MDTKETIMWLDECGLYISMLKDVEFADKYLRAIDSATKLLNEKE